MNNEPQRVLAMFEGVNVVGGLAMAALVFLLLLAALYFATPLVFFWQWPVAAALLWSVRAVLTNWTAFLGLVIVFIAIVLAIALVYGLVSAVLSLAFGGAAAFVLQLVSMVMSLFLQLLLAAAQWRAFVRVFPGEPDEEDGGDEGGIEV
jgi:CBS domain containing-hemolysin-like protein